MTAVDAALTRAGIEPLTRGETLTIHDFVRLAEALPDPQEQPA